MAGDEAPISRTKFDELKTDVNQIKTAVDRLASAMERLNTVRVRDHVDGRQRRDPTLQHKSYSNDHRGYRRQENYDARGLKIPSFNGKLHADDFLDWIDEVDRYFEYEIIPEDWKVKLVVYRLKGKASAWWDEILINRYHQGKDPVRTWAKMKKLLRDRFLPSNYKQCRVSLKDSFTLADTVRLAKKVERELEQNDKGPSSWMFLESYQTSYDYGKTKKPQFISEKESGFVKSTEEATTKTSSIKSMIEPEAFKTEIAKEKIFLVADNKTLAENLKQSEEVYDLVVIEKEEPAPIEIPLDVQAPIATKIPDVDGDISMKMDIMHEVSEAIVSDITHTDVVPVKEKDIIANQTIDDMCELLSGGSKTKEMECKNNSSEIKSVNNFDKIEMKLQAQEYKKQQGNNLEGFFKSSLDPHAVSHIKIMWKRFIQKFDSKEVIAEKVKEQMEKINAKYKADADRCRRRKIFIDEATIQANISSGSSFFQQGETDVGRLTNNFMEEQDNHKLNTNTHMLLTSAKKRSYLLIRKADSDILYMKIAYLDETKPTRLSDFRNLISITSF